MKYTVRSGYFINLRDVRGNRFPSVSLREGDAVYAWMVGENLHFTKIYRKDGYIATLDQTLTAKYEAYKFIASDEPEPGDEIIIPPPPPSLDDALVLEDVSIAKQRFYPEIPWTWKIDPRTGEKYPVALEVNYTSLSDHVNPNDTLKGDRVLVSSSWFAHMKKIQSEKAYNWVRTKHAWWFNKDDDWMAELITSAGSVHHILDENQTHYKIAGLPYDLETGSLDPNKHNWFHLPHLYTKITAHNMMGQMFRVGSGFNCYAPLLKKKPDLWIHKMYAERFTKPPFSVIYQEQQYTIVGYVLQGASVYGRTSTGETIPLLLARFAGERMFTTLQWSINSQTTVPE